MIDEKILVERLLLESAGCKVYKLVNPNIEDVKEFNAYKKCIEIANQLAEEQKQCIKSSCSNCETYDNEKHYCPKWCDVIENTVKELAEESNLTPCYLGSPCEYQNEDAKMPMEHWDNGWIPCSERLPEEPFGCLVTIMDCEPMTQTDFENILPYHVGYDGETWNDADGEVIPFEVLAWQPLPEPFKPKE